MGLCALRRLGLCALRRWGYVPSEGEGPAAEVQRHPIHDELLVGQTLAGEGGAVVAL